MRRLKKPSHLSVGVEWTLAAKSPFTTEDAEDTEERQEQKQHLGLKPFIG
jgi:hypothetical protein